MPPRKIINHEELWQKCLDIIRGYLPADVFSYWFSPARSVNFQDGAVTIEVPSSLYCEQYDERFSKVFRYALQKVYGQNVRTIYQYYIVKNDPDALVHIEDTKPPIPPLKISVSDPFDGIEYEKVNSQLNRIYNFANYCVGESNRLVYTIAESIGNNPKKTDFTPFFIYGNTGVGKTHLIQAIGLRIKELFPEMNVLYVASQTMINQYGAAVRFKKTNDFIYFYQNIDVLLIDDIQEFAGSVASQKKFFQIFNYLHQKGSLLIMTSDRPPVKLEDIMDRLISRFKWGVTEVLPNPDLALRKKILHHNAAKNGLKLPEDVVDLIAEYVTSSVRELEGIVMSLITRATYLNQPITRDLAKLVMQSAVKTTKSRINFDMIVESTAAYYNIDPDVIFSKNRVRDIADARQMIMFLTSKHTDLSYSAIGRKLARSHATVLYGVETIKSRLAVDKSLAEAVSSIEEMLQPK